MLKWQTKFLKKKEKKRNPNIFSKQNVTTLQHVNIVLNQKCTKCSKTADLQAEGFFCIRYFERKVFDFCSTYLQRLCKFLCLCSLKTTRVFNTELVWETHHGSWTPGASAYPEPWCVQCLRGYSVSPSTVRKNSFYCKNEPQMSIWPFFLATQHSILSVLHDVRSCHGF